jgi:hypothetical protein
MQGPFLKGEQAKEPQTTREAAKACVRDYVLLDWTLEDILTAFTRARTQTWEAQIGGVVEGDQGQQRRVGREQIAVTRLGNSPCFAVYNITELITEIRREAGLDEEKDEAREAVKALVRALLDDGTPEEEVAAMNGPASTGNWRFQMNGEIIDQGEPRSLHRQIAAIGPGRLYWSIFDVAEIIADLRREVRCRYCKAVLTNQSKGRTRKFCENKGKCKQAFHRRAKLEERRAAILQKHRALLDYWRQEHMSDELTTLLQGILLEKGEEAAYEATTAIVAYVDRERERWERMHEPQPAPPQRPTSRRAKRNK